MADNNTTFYRATAGVTQAVVAVAAPDTQYSYVIPAGTRKLKFQNRSDKALRYSFVTGKVATPTEPYFTLKSTGVYYEDNIKLYGKTIYFANDETGDVVEIETWQ